MNELSVLQTSIPVSSQEALRHRSSPQLRDWKILSFSMSSVMSCTDSTVLAYVLKLLNERHKYGVELQLLSVDEGITGYRDDSLEVCNITCRQQDQDHDHCQFKTCKNLRPFSLLWDTETLENVSKREYEGLTTVFNTKIFRLWLEINSKIMCVLGLVTYCMQGDRWPES